MKRAGILLLLALAAVPSVARAAEQGWTSVDSVVAVVNQDVVLRSEYERRQAAMAPALEQIKDPAERSRRRIDLNRQALRSLIDERLFFQAALALGLTATSPEVDRAVAEVKQQNKLDDAGLAKALAENGFTMSSYRQEIQRQILQAKVTNLLLRPRVRVTPQDMQAAYDTAKKRDPQRIGTFDEVKAPLYERLFEDAMMREQLRWLAERRAEAHIELRIDL